MACVFLQGSFPNLSFWLPLKPVFWKVAEYVLKFPCCSSVFHWRTFRPNELSQIVSFWALSFCQSPWGLPWGTLHSFIALKIAILLVPRPHIFKLKPLCFFGHLHKFGKALKSFWFINHKQLRSTVCRHEIQVPRVDYTLSNYKMEL